jgi:hypothetical protein
MRPTKYEFRLRGRLRDAMLREFEGMTATPLGDETLLRGLVRDSSALYGVLARIQALGLELIEMRRLPEATDPLPGDAPA